MSARFQGPSRPNLHSAGLARLGADWRAFAGPSYRTYLVLGLTQGAVLALSGTALSIPLFLTVGLGPGLTTLVASLALIGPAAQLAVPRLLQRTGGNLRGVTLTAAALGETRGLWLAVLTVIGTAGGANRAVLVVGLVAATAALGVFSGVAGANQQAWFAATLPEEQRRFVAPRVVGIGLAVSAVLLAAIAALLDPALRAYGLAIYAVPFFVGGLAGVLELSALASLPRPGRVRVARPASATPPPPGWSTFVAVATLASLGAGLSPYYAVFIISVLHASASAAVALSALTSAAAVVAATVGAGFLNRVSSSRLLRLAYVGLGIGWVLALASFPENPAALLCFVLVALLVSAGGAIVQIATNERLFRLVSGPTVFTQQGRFVGITATATAAGQVAEAVLLAVAPVGYPVFAVLFLSSGGVRLLAATRLPVADSWSDATRVMSRAELGPRDGP
ncbi:MAG: hypothetical protein ACLQBX_11365 [Candidatus Limnocylindrales bacterium]